MPNNDDFFYDGYDQHHNQILNGYKKMKPRSPKWGCTEYILVIGILISAICLLIGYIKEP